MIRALRIIRYLNPWCLFNRGASRGESVRLAFEALGPIFVKFGQLLSMRRDLLPDDIAEELAKLQDQVPPFPGSVAKQIIEQTYGVSITTLFSLFDETPLASASIAQVHAASLPDGSQVIIKVIRPDIARIIRQDIKLMYLCAKLVRRFWSKTRRLKPVEMVAEFERTIYHELDLLCEAANASQLRRNFQDSLLLYVPKVYWNYAKRNMMVMERIHGVRISDIATLKTAQTDLKKLAERGVEIFFTQVLRDNFFHADMHPGNLFVDITDPNNPKYIGVDFGIMGSLNPQDQRYIAENLLAFFKRDYRKVALLHVESGWVPPDTRIDHFTTEIRTVCEPIFEKPLKDISFGQLLLRLFQTADQFKMDIQPQLLLLQKTLLCIEGLGKALYPDLDLWETAKPLLEDWIGKQRSMKHALSTVIKELPVNTEIATKMPRLFYEVMQSLSQQFRQLKSTEKLVAEKQVRKQSKRAFLWGVGVTVLIALACYAAWH